MIFPQNFPRFWKFPMSGARAARHFLQVFFNFFSCHKPYTKKGHYSLLVQKPKTLLSSSSLPPPPHPALLSSPSSPHPLSSSCPLLLLPQKHSVGTVGADKGYSRVSVEIVDIYGIDLSQPQLSSTRYSLCTYRCWTCKCMSVRMD